MNLRDGSVVGGSKGSLPSSSSRVSQGDFARGAARVLGRWTALRLAVEGGWGGPESGAKAGLLLDDVVSWFASDSGEFFSFLEGGGGGGGGGEARRVRWRFVSSPTPAPAPTPTPFEHDVTLTPLCPSLFTHRLSADHYADDLEVELAAAMLDDFGAQLEDGSPREVRLKKRFPDGG